MKHKNPPANAPVHTRTRARATLLLLLPLALLAASCATQKPQPPHVPLTGDPLADAQTQLATAPAQDKPLWQYRLAATALRHDRPDIAKTNLDAALATTTAPNLSTVATTATAAKPQPARLFTGAPYERMMANYYRALLYWADGDLENARYRLRVAQLPSTAPAASTPINETYANDCILPDYLDGLLSVKLDPQHNPAAGADALARARANAVIQNRPPLPDYDPAANVLIFVEYGDGPLKYYNNGDGKIHATALPANTCQLARLTIGGRTIDLAPCDDLGYQALTHEREFMDKFFRNNSSFAAIADFTGNVGSALMKAGIVVAKNPLLPTGGNGQNGDARAYLAFLAAQYAIATMLMVSSAPFFIASYAIPKTDKPIPDTRSWDNLPRFLSFTALKLPPGRHEAELNFYAPDGTLLPQQTQHFTITVPANPTKDTVIYRSLLRN